MEGMTRSDRSEVVLSCCSNVEVRRKTAELVKWINVIKKHWPEMKVTWTV